MNRLLMPVLAVMLAALSVTPVGAGYDGALPPDGGAPFAAYATRIAAIQTADWSAWKQVTAPEEIAAEIAQAGDERAAAAEFAETADFLRLMTPSRAEFIEGRIDGERATLFVRATRPAS